MRVNDADPPVRSRFVARFRTKQVDTDGPVKLHQPPCHLFDHFLFRELSLHRPGFLSLEGIAA